MSLRCLRDGPKLRSCRLLDSLWSKRIGRELRQRSRPCFRGLLTNRFRAQRPEDLAESPNSLESGNGSRGVAPTLPGNPAAHCPPNAHDVQGRGVHGQPRAKRKPRRKMHMSSAGRKRTTLRGVDSPATDRASFAAALLLITADHREWIPICGCISRACYEIRTSISPVLSSTC